MNVAEDLITKGFRGVYPIIPDRLHQAISEGIAQQKLPGEFSSLEELLKTVEPLMEGLEKRINACKGIQNKA